MGAKKISDEHFLDDATVARNLDLAQQAIASVVIEGGYVTAETQNLLSEMAHGRVGSEDALQALKKRYNQGVQQTHGLSK